MVISDYSLIKLINDSIKNDIIFVGIYSHCAFMVRHKVSKQQIFPEISLKGICSRSIFFTSNVNLTPNLKKKSGNSSLEVRSIQRHVSPCIGL